MSKNGINNLYKLLIRSAAASSTASPFPTMEVCIAPDADVDDIAIVGKAVVVDVKSIVVDVAMAIEVDGETDAWLVTGRSADTGMPVVAVMLCETGALEATAGPLVVVMVVLVGPAFL